MALSKGMKRGRAGADLLEGPISKRICHGRGQYTGTNLRRPTAPSNKPWPTSRLNAFTNPMEEFGWGKLMDEALESRGWQILRPCTIVAKKGVVGPKGEPEDVGIFTDEFEGLLQGENIRGEVEPDQYAICRRNKNIPSHALMLMNSAISRDDFAKMFITHRRNICRPGRGYCFGAICGSEQSLEKCNFSKAFRNDDWYPTAYILPQEEHLLRQDIKAGGKSYWIAKPNNDFGGSGITVWSHDDPGFQKLIRENAAKGSKRSIVQRYLHDPMLIGPYKFHMRIHMVITSLKPLKAFVHEGGQVLCGTRPYSLSKKLLNGKFDKAVHLTNQCFNANPINKDNYMKSKPVIGKGQQITIPELEKYLQKNHKGFDKKDLWRQIVHIARRNAEYMASFRTVRKYADKLDSGECFEVFGMDLMLDKNCKVWMCETNNSPGLGYPDRKVLGEPNPDYQKEINMCRSVHHDTMTLLGFDACKKQTKGSLSHWYEIEFPEEDLE